MGVSLNIHTTGSRSSMKEPNIDSCHLYAGHHLHSIRSSLADCSLRNEWPQVLMSKKRFTTPQQWFGLTHLFRVTSLISPVCTQPVWTAGSIGVKENPISLAFCFRFFRTLLLYFCSYCSCPSSINPLPFLSILYTNRANL